MKLSEKYEIAELLTSGRVTTFAAKERATQEPVIIHSYECSGDNQPSSTASILTRFVALAPNPPGVVMKAGIDEESSSAFLVTKMPTSEALQEWVRAYRSFKPGASAASPSASTPPARVAEPQVPNFKPAPIKESFPLPDDSASTKKPGEYTQLFRELEALPKPAGRVGSAKPPLGSSLEPSGPMMAQSVEAAKASKEPGEITRLFMGVSKPQPVKEVPKKDNFGRLGSATDSGIALPAEQPHNPGSFTQQFFTPPDQIRRSTPADDARSPKEVISSAPFPDSIFSSNQPQPLNQEPKSGGEFTKFFRSPFEQPAPIKPIQVPDEATIPKPARQQSGEFTMMFGRDAGTPVANSPAPTIPAPEPPKNAGSFTAVFGRDSLKSSMPPSRDSDPSGLISAQPLEPARTAPPVPPVAPQFPTPVQMPNFPAVIPVAQENPMANRGRVDATNAFMTPGVDPMPTPQQEKAPSEFTMFINRREVDAALAGPPAEAPAEPTPAGGFAMPAAPAPKPTPPPAPKLPPALQLHKPQISPWPLITAFVGLLGMGSILVMYFLLRH